MDDHRLARILGWVTIGAGLSLCAAPGPLMNAFGMGNRPNLGRFLGARDLVIGAGLLLQGQNTAAWPPGPSGGTGHRSASPRPPATAP